MSMYGKGRITETVHEAARHGYLRCATCRAAVAKVATYDDLADDTTVVVAACHGEREERALNQGAPYLIHEALGRPFFLPSVQRFGKVSSEARRERRLSHGNSRSG